MGVTHDLARFSTQLSFESLPPKVVEKVKLHFMDGMGVAAAGAAHDGGRIIAKVIESMRGASESTVIGCGFQASATDASLVNGTFAHLLDFDDVGGFSHNNGVLTATILALGEKLRVPGRLAITAYAGGFEAASHLRRAGQVRISERAFHLTPVFGTIAATIASCKLLGLDQRQTQMALGIAGSEASGLGGNRGTMTKGLHAGLAARNGILAALLSKEGFTGADDIIERPTGFAHAFMAERDARDQVASLGKEWHLLTDLSIKKYPCGYLSHGFIDLIFSLMNANSLVGDQIDEVELGGVTYDSPVMFYRHPTSDMEARFSLPFIAAAAIANGTVDHGTFSSRTLSDAKVKQAQEKIRVNVHSKWDHAPERYTVAIRTRNGSRLTAAINRSEIKGSAKDPLSWEEVEAKYRTNGSMALPQRQVNASLKIFKTLEKLPDLRRLGAAVRGQEAAGA